MKSPQVVTGLVIAAAFALLAGIELRNGFLVVYVPGWIEDLGRVVWLLEAAEKIAERVQAEVGEAAPAVG